MSSGQPLENTRLRVVDSQGADLPDGQVGEILIQSNCMLNEYYHRSDVTQKVLVDGWFYTGDYGFLMDGDLYVSGRKKDLIIVGGKNIYPQDLEALASEIPGVHPGRVVAFGLESDESGTEEVVLIVEAESAEPEEQERISDLVRQHVTRNSAVSLRYVQVVPPQWILKTSSGKTARSANKEKYLQSLSNPGRLS
jgi:acyl-CoA synthetase (AMP-forming)/AMP-acid ligase II